jgi:RND family efflux transporter MFP subunit
MHESPSRASRLVRRLALPALGLVLTAALVVQGRRLAADPSPATNVAAASTEPGHIVAEGRLVAYPGAEIEVGTEIAGLLERVTVKEKETVRRGQLLAALRADDVRAEIAETRARIAEAEADIRLGESDIRRLSPLIAQGVEPRNRLERTERDVAAATARKATAEAAIVRLEATLAKSRILAPLDGVVLARRVDSGETVDAGASLFSLGDLTRTRIEAEIDEFDAGRVRLDAPVTITAEGLDGQSWQGRVEEIPDQVVPRRTRPQDPGRPSDTRVLLVKIALSGPTPLKLGQRVEIAIGG